ncbi:MAG: DUF1501 domain-containing protein [Proteobacteria bacterium]|nr:DUF1501 domain-containing protein [Pseudomonadota bacterium]MBI3499478.1 DUF1501 domain-containing protein [Pseudomonadota bacterium]
MLTRRHTLLGLSALAAAAPLGLPSLALASANTDKRLVFVVLRGGLDGLAAVPPYAESEYRSLRGALALPEPGQENGMIGLDGRFGLHPALAPLERFWQARQFAVLHAVATPYRQRSHFDGQDLLENGTDDPRAKPEGWLNRAIGLLGSRKQRLGLALGHAVPLVLRGSAPVASWAPAQLPDASPDFLAKVAALYRRDALLGPALEEGLGAHAMSAELIGDSREMGGNMRGPQAFRIAATAGAKLLAAAEGPRIAVLEITGWDTHAQQNGRLMQPLTALAEGLAALADGLGPVWSETIVVAASEFGRTVAANGTGGTDHGTAGVAFILGGKVAGGRILGRWPGLAENALYEARDLMPTTDLRSLLKGILGAHLGLPDDALDRVVFPGSSQARALPEILDA